VDDFPLQREDLFAVDLNQLSIAISRGYDLVVLVNPNSPTGQHIPREQLEAVLKEASGQTRIWVDETYVEYVGSGQSLESIAAKSENIIVCKSMSKVYALSGTRVAYLCAGAHQLEALRAVTPPWVVSLPGQVAAVKALENPDYYSACYRETKTLRESLAEELSTLGWLTFPAVANFLLCELPPGGPDSVEMIARCRKLGLFLRHPGNMGTMPGGRFIRIAVKDVETNRRMVEILRSQQ
jgi:histidinol-phosphate/aromatic aminotransferase/cobyric acid decarboxylase-like protein